MYQYSKSLESRLQGSTQTRFWQELFGNALHFPLANLLLELLLKGPATYLVKMDSYLLLLASVCQAYWMSRRTPPRWYDRLLGNLIGPALYSAIEIGLDGWDFWADPNHTAYWVFALTIGVIQALRYGWPRLTNTALVSEQITRASIILAMYAIFEVRSSPTPTSLLLFLNDSSHVFVAIVIPVLGLSLGLSEVTTRRYLNLLRETSTQLQVYAEWLLGRQLLEQAMTDPTALSMARRERTVLLMDIRGFTHWSEPRRPEDVVTMLNRYYDAAEIVLKQHQAIKTRWLADEVLAVFASADEAVAAASELRAAMGTLFSELEIGVGIGLNTGLVVEGLMGSHTMQAYDVIGDTVNTAKRIEGGAAAGEVLLAETTWQKLTPGYAVSLARQIAAKGKALPVTVYPLAGAL